MTLPTTSFPVEDVFFLDAVHGWADSDSPMTGLSSEVLYQTTDGGKSWSRVGALPPAPPMGYVYGVGNYRVTFSRQSDGSLTGWYVGATQLYTTRDAGLSWRPLSVSVPAALGSKAGLSAANFSSVVSGRTKTSFFVAAKATTRSS